jgi:hypothetical protein
LEQRALPGVRLCGGVGLSPAIQALPQQQQHQQHMTHACDQPSIPGLCMVAAAQGAQACAPVLHRTRAHDRQTGPDTSGAPCCVTEECARAGHGVLQGLSLGTRRCVTGHQASPQLLVTYQCTGSRTTVPPTASSCHATWSCHQEGHGMARSRHPRGRGQAPVFLRRHAPGRKLCGGRQPYPIVELWPAHTMVLTLVLRWNCGFLCPSGWRVGRPWGWLGEGGMQRSPALCMRLMRG